MRSRRGRRWPVAETRATAAALPVVRIVKDMGITHAEFFRTVRSLLDGEEAEVGDDGVTLRRGAAAIEIRLGPEGARSLGRFRLPRTEVELLFRGCTAAEVSAFVARFDNCFRRGGG